MENARTPERPRRGRDGPDLETLLHAVGDMVFTLDRDQRHTGAYGRQLAESGMTADDFLGKTPAEVLGPEAAAVHEEANRRALSGEPVTYEWSAPGPGGVRWFHTSLSPLTDARGRVCGIAGVGRDITDRKAAEDELRASRDFKDLLLASMDAGVLVVDMSSRRVMECNPATERMLGYPREELVGSGTRMLHVDDDVYRRHGRDLLEAVNAGRTFRGVWRLKRQDGRVLDCEITASLLREVDGCLETIGIIQDITERTRAERALKASEERFRGVVESAPLGMHFYRLQPDGRLVFTGANPAADVILRLDNSRFVGKAIEEAFPGLVGTEVPDAYRRVAAEGGTWSTDQISYEEGGISGAFTVRAFQTEPGSMAAAFLDITERARAEEELRRSERDLKEAQRIGRVGSWSWDMVSGKVTWSDELYRILGLEPGSVAPSRAAFAERVHPEDSPMVEADMTDALSAPGRTSFECRIVCPDGSARYLSNIIETSDDGTGRPLSAVGTVADLTELKQAQKLKEDFLSMVSHELRSPLASIVGYASVVERVCGPDVPKEAAHAARGIGRRAWEMVALVDELLEVSRLTSGKFELNPAPTKIDELLHEVSSQVTVSDRHHLIVDVREDLPPVECDAKRVAHVVRNLLSNAVKFSPSGGEIRMSAAVADQRLLIQVSDQGVGIADEDLERVFGQFEQVDMSSTRGFGGVGVGLYIVKAVAEAHGGAVSVDSEVGRGSTFTVELPLGLGRPEGGP